MRGRKIRSPELLSRFQAAEAAWEEHNTRATAIGEAQTAINRHIGYGGFIHNFKNLVLRRDLPRYQPSIETDIASFEAQFERLEHLLRLPEDRAALAQLRATFEEYADKYRLAVPLVATALDGARDLYEDGLPSRCAWVFGHEGQGVAAELLAAARLKVRIPHDMAAVESLNVGAAAAICLFEQRRQALRGKPG